VPEPAPRPELIAASSNDNAMTTDLDESLSVREERKREEPALSLTSLHIDTSSNMEVDLPEPVAIDDNEDNGSDGER